MLKRCWKGLWENNQLINYFSPDPRKQNVHGRRHPCPVLRVSVQPAVVHTVPPGSSGRPRPPVSAQRCHRPRQRRVPQSDIV